MRPENNVITSIADLIRKIQTDEKKGTAFERYNSHYLWDLGQRVREYEQKTRRGEDAVAEIIGKLRLLGIKCQPVLLKNAETITKVWEDKYVYDRDTSDVPYGKLRDVLTILNPDFSIQHNLSINDRQLLIQNLSQTTFEEFRALVKDLRLKYDPLGESVDFDELFSDIYNATAMLEDMILAKNLSRLSEFRENFDSRSIDLLRKQIASIKDEKTFSKLGGEISNSNTLSTTCKDAIAEYLLRISKNLGLLTRSSVSRRNQLRSSMGTSALGKLSTLLKAASSDDEMERYFRSREVLEKLAATT